MYRRTLTTLSLRRYRSQKTIARTLQHETTASHRPNIPEHYGSVRGAQDYVAVPAIGKDQILMERGSEHSARSRFWASQNTWAMLSVKTRRMRNNIGQFNLGNAIGLSRIWTETNALGPFPSTSRQMIMTSQSQDMSNDQHVTHEVVFES